MLHAARPLARIAALALGLVVLAAPPASADAAGPSDFRSEVTGIVPAVEGIDATIRGGDSFLEISVDPGHTVLVEGYSGEPYVQVLEDGTVQRNRLSRARYLNDDRRGRVDIPADVLAAIDAGADPEWETVAGDGTYAWHDHRVHWMAEASPPVARGERVPGDWDPWRVPIEVDGTAAEVRGTLTYESATSPLRWAALALLAGGGLAWFGRGRGLRLGAGLLVGTSVAAVVVGRADWASTPEGGGNPLLWALPLVAVVAAVGAVALASRGTGVV
ncbi:MAG: hypothetical protein ACRDZU_12495, partial [Acidimicrobiales bacterium]